MDYEHPWAKGWLIGFGIFVGYQFWWLPELQAGIGSAFWGGTWRSSTTTHRYPVRFDIGSCFGYDLLASCELGQRGPDCFAPNAGTHCFSDLSCTRDTHLSIRLGALDCSWGGTIWRFVDLDRRTHCAFRLPLGLPDPVPILSAKVAPLRAVLPVFLGGATASTYCGMEPSSFRFRAEVVA